jgi:Leucine-rich repeat (LRR) protein
MTERKAVDLTNVTKFLTMDIAKIISSLDLSHNHLNLTVDLDGMISLKKLNLSHNNLTSISNLTKMQKLTEFKVGWNHLRFFDATITSISWACPNLTFLEILPNPFQVGFEKLTKF